LDIDTKSGTLAMLTHVLVLLLVGQSLLFVGLSIDNRRLQRKLRERTSTGP
jgi:hypothetical protein